MIRPGIRRLFRLPLRGAGLTERDLNEEMRLHLELRIEQLERQGLSTEAARAEAWRRFDRRGVARLRSGARRRNRRLRLVEWWSGLKGEVGYGLRTFSRRPFYALGVTGTLALGGAGALVGFVIAWSVWLAPMPYPDPAGLVRLYELKPLAAGVEGESRESRRQRLSPGLLADFRAHDWRTLEAVSAVWDEAPIVWRRAGEARTITRTGLSPEGFRILGMEPVMGRVPTRSNEVLLSESFWRSVAGGDRAVIGSTMQLAAATFRIVGVAPLAAYPGRSDIVMAVPEGAGDRGFRVLDAVARLRAGHTPEEAEAEVSALVAALSEIHPEHRGWGADVEVLKDDLIRPFRDIIALLNAAGLAFLLLAVVNVTGIVAARRVEGLRDRSIRLALGASEWRLLRHALMESLVLAVVGTALAILAAQWLVGPVRLILPTGIPRLDQVAVTPTLAGGGLLVGIAVGGLIGVGGYLVSRGAQPPTGAGPVWRRGRVPGRRSLVVGQVALVALILAAGTAIGHRAATLHGIDLGFEPEGVVVTSTVLDHPDRWGVVQGLLEGLRRRGVPAAAALNEPLNNEELPQVSMARQDGPGEIVYELHLTSADYFDVMGIEVIAGEVYEDERPAGRPGVVVSDAFVRSYFPPGTSAQEAVGRVLRPLPYESEGPFVVGVARSTRHAGPEAPVVPEVYVPLAHLTLGAVSLLLRAEPDRATAALDAVSGGVDPELRWTPPVPYSSRLQEWYGPVEVQLFTVTLLSALGLLLSSVGLYSFMAYRTAAGRKEIGIRKALGARDATLVRSTVASGLVLVAVGVVIGLAAWYGLLPWTSRWIDGVDGAGLVVPAAVSLVIGAACVLAMLGPALRAARVDPVRTLNVDG